MVRKKRGRGQSTPVTSDNGKIRSTTSRGRSPAAIGKGEIHASTSRGRSRTATRRVKSLSPSPSPSPPAVSDIKSLAASSVTVLIGKLKREIIKKIEADLGNFLVGKQVSCLRCGQKLHLYCGASTIRLTDVHHLT